MKLLKYLKQFCFCNSNQEIDYENKYKDITKYNCPPLFTMKGKKLYCKVIDVYDGDTCNIVFELNNELLHYKLRLYGINSKELKPSKNLENREQYIIEARLAKEALENKVLNKVVYIEFVQEEKFGRLMGTIYSTNNKTININEEMVKEGHAVYFMI
jgi:endonuclease YncB( thermonuclease family)